MRGAYGLLAGVVVGGLMAVLFFKFVLATTVTSTNNITVTVQVIGLQICGNDFVEPPEECDDGSQCEDLTTDCTDDALICAGIGGGTCAARDGDGCSATCLLEAVCGNGILESPEECDDGNLTNNDGCSDLCLLEAISTSTPVSGWAGPQILATADFFGFTSPFALVRLTKFGRMTATVQADSQGLFSIRLSALPVGTYDFGLYAEDRFGRLTLTTNFSLSLVARSVTTIENIFLTPTISISRHDLLPGQKLLVFGETAPNSQVQVYVGNNLYEQTIYSNESGFWQLELSSENISAGSHSIKAKTILPSGLTSSFSESLFLQVVPAPIPQGECRGPDLNQDGWVNILDLSIILHYWRQTNPSFICADINRDGIVDIVDFSIMLYWWSGQVR